MPEEIEVGELLYELNVRMTSSKDFGIGLTAIIGGDPVPPDGARFDVALEGHSAGSVAGMANLMGYLFIGGDLRFQLHLHGAIETADGTRIALSGVSESDPSETLGLVQLREQAELHTASPEFAWVNGVSVSARGTLNMGTGRLMMKGYAA